MPNCKYIKQQEIVSYNGGVDWQDVMPAQYRKGQLIAHDSEDCGSIDTLYRWRKLSGVYLCVDDMKYEKLILDESYDGGLSWYPAYPSEYTTGNAVGIDEDYCNDKFVGHYILVDANSVKCPQFYKWNGVRCVYVDPIKVVKCDGNPELTSADTNYYSSYPARYTFSLFSAEIGKCVTSIAASAFTRTILRNITIPNSVTSIGERAFMGCTSLSGMNTTIPGELNIPSGVTSIGNRAFLSCSGITSIVCNPTTPPSIGYNAFSDTNDCPIYVPCGSIGKYQELFIPPSSMVDRNTEYLRRLEPIGGVVCVDIIASIEYSSGKAPYTYYVGTGSALTYSMVEAPGGAPIRNASGVTFGSGCTSIGENAFANCSKLTGNIAIPDSVTNIGQGAFYYCTGLTNCTIGSGVTSIGDSAFERCSGLTSIDIPSGVTSIGNRAFNGCSGLTGITVNATTPPTLGSNALDGTSNCTIYVPCSSRSTYQAASGWSDYASRIYGIPPCEIIYKIVTRNGDDSYSIECNSSSILTKAEVSDVNFSYAYSAVIGNCVTEIAASAFTGGYSVKVTSVTMPDTITTIGNYAFYNCKLTSVTIPSSVTSIGQGAFRYCTGLTSVTIMADEPPTLGNYAFDYTNNCPIYVPNGSVNTYKSTSGWSTYASRIQTIT